MCQTLHKGSWMEDPANSADSACPEAVLNMADVLGMPRGIAVHHMKIVMLD